MTAHLPTIQRGAEPFFHPGGTTGVLCVHGFTASPEEMRWLGEHLAERGLTVYGPRLPGHGTSPAMMRRQHWLNWYEDVIDGIALLRAHCTTVYAVGLSMGGLLTLRAAAAGELDGAVIMASPLYVKQPLMRFARWLKYVRPYYTPEITGELDRSVRAIQRAMGREDYGRAAYDGRRPVASVAELHALMGEVRANLAAITVPLMLIYSKGDTTVPFDNLRLIAEGVRSSDLVQHTLEHSDHILTQDSERETVYEMVWDFIQARTGA